MNKANVAYEKENIRTYSLLCKIIDFTSLNLEFKILKYARKNPPRDGKVALVIKNAEGKTVAVAAQKEWGKPRLESLAYSIVEQLKESKLWPEKI